MKQFFEFIPLIIFFAVYKMVDIYAATASLMLTTGLMLAFNYFKNGRLEKMHIVTFVMVMLFGTLTLVLHDDVFIKWKVTVVYALFSLALLVTQFIFKKPAVKQMLGKELSLPDNIWNNLNLAWAVFFALLGVVNVYIAFSLSMEVWVNFKVFGLLGVTLAFTVLSGVYIYKYLPVPESEKEASANKNSEE
ncbi:septation protein A [Psychromonas aquimarina]|uniref:septation protein A n=1 Tax=Psychromonas aquimarina TaxID=444919 RepID=UPI00040EA60B|nr:septation protein A [Psychromonas aquimarina]